MKKIILTSLSVFALTTANAQLSNLGFETWASGSPSLWTTLNGFAAGSFAQITSGAPEGLYAGAATVVSCPLCPIAGLPNPFPGGAVQQDDYTAKPTTLTFKWKGEVLAGDTSLIGAYLTLVAVPVGDALFYVMPGTNQTTWLTQTVPFTYYSASSPDSALIGALSDAWVLQLLVTGSATGTSVLGTHVDVDDIVMSGGTVGFEMLESTNSLIMAYPNPANSVINFNLLGTDATMFEIIDISGKIIYAENNILSKHALNIENYNNGTYLVKFFNDKRDYIGSTRFNVAK
jgi:hypothetical protein